MKQLLSITIPNFTNTIVISNKQQVKPYKKGNKLPLKYSKFIGTDYFWNANGKFVDKLGNLVASNASKAGTPRIWQVNGQDIYNDRIDKFARANYIEKLHSFILPYFEDREFITETNLKLELRFLLFDKTQNKAPDNKMIDEDNLVSIWQKVTRDVMKTTVLPDDNQRIFRASENSIEYVETESEQTLEIILWKR